MPLSNIEYTAGRIALKKPDDVFIDINSFEYIDNYPAFEYTVTLPYNLSAYYGQDIRFTDDDFFNYFQVITKDAKTSIIINEARIWAFNVYEDERYVYMQAVLPKTKYDFIVIIDPGHGGTDPGTQHNGLIESELNLDIALALHELIDNDPRMKVYSTRLTDIYPSLTERSQFANENGDLFISIHNNAAEYRQGYVNPHIHGTETFYYPHTNDDVSSITSLEFADIVHTRLINTLGTEDRKVRNNNYYVLTTTQIPAILVEIGFITNPGEAASLAKHEYRELAAYGIYLGLCDVYETIHPAE